MDDDWKWYPPPSKRRSAKDGVASRSRRGRIGATWWSRRFVDAMERICDVNRLRRGRSYARSGQVSRLEVDAGLVTATVQGSRRSPYRVEIAVHPFDDAEWAAVEMALADQAIFLAGLLAGEMPDEIEEAFDQADLSLFPNRPEDLRTSCTCPDWANPCKHIAATLYILAERFDDDPFEIFRWRGRGRDELIRSLRSRRMAAATADGPPADTGAGAVRGKAPAAVDLPPPADSASFWSFGTGIASIPLVPKAPAVPDAALRELGDLPAEIGGAFAANVLRDLYARATSAAERAAFE
jgi:uncharacterized Zn finger protein